MMDFRPDPEGEQTRRRARDFFDRHLTDEMRHRAHESGTIHDWDLYRALGREGWLASALPEALGGQGASPWQLAAFFEEVQERKAPLDSLSTTLIIAGVIAQAGTPWQKEHFLPKVLAGEIIMALGYSEPDSGSDVAAAKTRAVRDGEEWVINGQKMFTTLAHESHYVLMLTRTNPDVPKHRGLTFFVLPLDQPGVEIQPVHTLGGERTNITFYTDVRIDDRWRLGEVDGGWEIMKIALAYERGMFGGTAEGRHLYQHALQWARDERRDDGRRPIDEPLVRERLVRSLIGDRVSRLLAYKTIWVAATGALPGLEGSIAKLVATESFQQMSNWFMDMVGPDALIQHGEDDSPADGWIEATWRHAVVTTIYGGTSEIQRNGIAERMLDLPKARR